MLSILFKIIWSSFEFSLCRKRFAHFNSSINNVEKSTSNDVFFINAMARLHDLICDTVDDLNACYSIQVRSKWIWDFFFSNILNFVILSRSSDNVQYWSVFASLDFCHLFAASYAFSFKHTINASISLQLLIVLFVCIKYVADFKNGQ